MTNVVKSWEWRIKCDDEGWSSLSSVFPACCDAGVWGQQSWRRVKGNLLQDLHGMANQAYARKEVTYFLLHTLSPSFFFFLLPRMADVCHEWKQHLTSNLFYLLKTLNPKLDIIRSRLCSRTASHHQHNGCVCPSNREMFLLWHLIVEMMRMKLGQKVFLPSQTNVL